MKPFAFRFLTEVLDGPQDERPLTPKAIYIPSKLGDPLDFDTYIGQPGLKERFVIRLEAMTKGDSLRALLSAPAGLGKTSFVRVLAREMSNRGLIDEYRELVGSSLENKEQLDSLIRSIKPNTLLFIDEIHGISNVVRDALLPVIQDNIYSVSATELRQLPKGISWTGATTDLGKVHPALQRRLMVMTLDPLSTKDRTRLLFNLPFPITEEAAEEIAKRSWTPWEAKDELFATAVDVAKIQKSEEIGITQVNTACNVLGVDKFGLRPRDRAVLNALFTSKRATKGTVKHALSARALITMSDLDSLTYYNSVEPKLLRLGYVRVSTGIGRELTEKAIEDYFKGVE